jgi:CRISPR-associated endonuclease/helicase Cas3
VRLHGLAGKTVIFDEVHAYDTYTGRLLDRLLEYLRALDCTVILLSATLPSERRNELYQAFTGRAIPNTLAYPRILAATRDTDLEPSTFKTSASSSKTISVEWLPNDLNAALLALSDRLGDRGCGAFVFNTVAEAQAAYRRAKELFGSSLDELMILHSRFPLGERQEREERLLRLFGKGAESRPKGRALVVATQVIEQSLDLDFDLMASEIAPIDLLLQRTGRLHRHARPDRPNHLGSTRLLVRKPEELDGVPGYGGSGYVYGIPVLMRTHALLLRADIAEHGFEVPGKVEDLIESVYSGSIDAVISVPWSASFQTALEKWAKKADAHRRGADGRTLREPRSAVAYWEVESEFTDDEDSPGIHSDLRPMTRLGENAIRVLCLFQGTKNELYFDPESREPVETREPDAQGMKRLLGRVASLPEYYVHGNEVEEIPFDRKPLAGWKSKGVLRHLPVLTFRRDRTCDLDEVTIHWDKEVGLEYLKKRRRR